MAAMNRERIAERAARAVYGTIISVAVIIALVEAGAAAGETIIAVIGATIAAAAAETYAAAIGSVIRTGRHRTRAEMRVAAIDSAAGSIAALVPLIPFVLAEVGAIELETAGNVGVWLGLGVLALYTAFANRLAGLWAFATWSSARSSSRSASR